MSREWRLIIEETPAEGLWNMALDRAIQSACAEGEAPPTVRLYGWVRPTVTLGRFQDASSVDREACEEYGVDVVRRYTGGRGVLHDDEVTYSVAASVGDGIPRGTAASYRHLCAGLIETYARLGVTGTSIGPRASGRVRSPSCYLQSTQADLTLGVRKLSGSAQVWLGDTVLQHGSFTLTRDVEREAAVFGLSDVETHELGDSTIVLAEAWGGETAREEVRAAIVGAFERVFDLRFEVGRPGEGEIELAHALLPDVRVAQGG